MKTVENLQKVSLLIFIVLAGLHITSSLMIPQGYFVPEANLINKTIDMPVIISGFSYAATSLKRGLSQNKMVQQILDLGLIVSALFLFLLLIYVNFLLKDLNVEVQG